MTGTRRAHDLALDRANEREAFGHKLGEPGMVQERIAESVVDRSVQIRGSLGVSGDEILARLTGEIRSFRIYDGPTEVHRWSIARRALRGRAARAE